MSIGPSLLLFWLLNLFALPNPAHPSPSISPVPAFYCSNQLDEITGPPPIPCPLPCFATISPVDNVLGIFDQWLFGANGVTDEEVKSILVVLCYFYEQMEDAGRMGERKRKIFGGIGQLFRYAQQKSLKQFAKEKGMTENGIWEQLQVKVEIAQEEPQNWELNLALWAERMPYLMDRMLGEIRGEEEKVEPNIGELVGIIGELCRSKDWDETEWTGWGEFCGELAKLDQKGEGKGTEEERGKTPKGKGPAENETPNGKKQKDETPQGKKQKDETMQGKRPKDETMQGKRPKDETPQEKRQKDETPQEKTQKEKTTKGKIQKDETLKNKGPAGDETPKEKKSNSKNPKVKMGKKEEPTEQILLNEMARVNIMEHFEQLGHRRPSVCGGKGESSSSRTKIDSKEVPMLGFKMEQIAQRAPEEKKNETKTKTKKKKSARRGE